jgi:hypothetical protein
MMMCIGSLLNEMKQFLSLHILCNASESTTHVGIAGNVRAALVVLFGSQKRSLFPPAIPCSASDAVAFVWDSDQSDFVSLVLFRLLTLFQTSKPS